MPSAATHRAFSSVAFANRKKMHRGKAVIITEPPPFSFSVSLCENIESGWKCVSGASLLLKQTPATSFGEMHKLQGS